ncbi:ABC transporter ATP-binding protein [Janibacter melonis]|uniref:ABC transporter ATP-binding protein n=1 Tax=Janibacter melonis TaxID=262209 RepID=UPI003FD87EE7
MITHDLGVVAGLCDEVNVLYGGRLAERGDRHPLFAEPRHPYTGGLLASVPGLERPRRAAQPGARLGRRQPAVDERVRLRTALLQRGRPVPRGDPGLAERDARVVRCFNPPRRALAGGADDGGDPMSARSTTSTDGTRTKGRTATSSPTSRA